MAEQKKIQLYTDRACTVEASPETMAKNVTLSDGLDVESVLKHDLTAPTVVHEETSFKIGVGDIDVSSSVVDGEPSKVVIKGKTYQNILPEPSLRSSMTNGKSMQKLNEGYENVNVVDGVAKSAILKGQTLVNLTQSSGYGMFGTSGAGKINRTTTPNGMIYETTLDELNSYITIRTGAHPLVKANTVYTLCFEIVQNTITVNGESYKGMTVCGVTDCYFGRETNQLYHNRNFSLSKGVKRILLTTPSDISTYDGFGFGFPSLVTAGVPQGQVFEIRNVMLIEGDYTNVDVPYFTGMQSVRMPVLTTTGKNLICIGRGCDHSVTVNGVTVTRDVVNQTITFNGTADSNNVAYSLDTLFTQKIKKGERYALSCYLVSGTADRVAFRVNTRDWSNSMGCYVDTPVYRTFNEDVVYDGCTFRIDSGATFNNAVFKVMFERVDVNSTATSYEPYKSNILSASEEVVLRSVENVQDTINLNTGTYIQRIGEVILDGSEQWSVLDDIPENTTIGFSLLNVLPLRKTGDKFVKVNCDKLPSYKENLWHNDKIGCVTENNINNNSNDTQLQVRILKSTLSTLNSDAFKSWLQTNPLTVQYILETPIVKTVDLSSYGNYEKIVLDGSQNLNLYGDTNVYYGISIPNILPFLQGGNAFANKVLKTVYNMSVSSSKYSIAPANSLNVLCFSLDGKMSKEEASQYLSENPITVWYQTTTSKENSITEVLSFSNGHIQLSSEEGSLIPSLDYEVPTSNSYHMDLMKTNTRHTMKAKTASGTFTIDGTSYGAGTNGTFTTPTSMTNKLLIMSNNTNEEVMILEGDVVSKTIPYFKGIKSAFEDESKIEVLSTGKNLFDNSRVNNYLAEYLDNGYVKATGGKQGDIFAEQKAKPFIKPNTKYTITVDVIENTMTGLFEIQYNGEKRASLKTSFYIDSGFVGVVSKTCNSKEVIENELIIVPKVIAQNTSGHVIFRIIVEETSTPTSYESHKSNSTKIPLLSPLRSLPNGVCDELIIDRMKKKATLIQRVGMCKFDSKDKYNCGLYIDGDWATNNSTGFIYRGYTPKGIDHVENKNGYHICSDLATSTRTDIHSKTNICVLGDGQYMGLKISNDKVGYKGTLANDYLSKNPITVYYELATPVVTEINLEEFPLVYKDGHIFLNSEIAPVVEISYNVNQTQQIQANNETLQRHELDIDNLDSLIAGFIHADYQLRLFQFDYDMATMSARKGK